MPTMPIDVEEWSRLQRKIFDLQKLVEKAFDEGYDTACTVYRLLDNLDNQDLRVDPKTSKQEDWETFREENEKLLR